MFKGVVFFCLRKSAGENNVVHDIEVRDQIKQLKDNSKMIGSKLVHCQGALFCDRCAEDFNGTAVGRYESGQ